MNKEPEHQSRWQRLVSWVDGDREPKDQSLFVMERRPPRDFRPSEEEHDRQERRRLNWFFRGYPAVAILIAAVLVGVLLAAVLEMPAFGRADNPINNEVSEHYLENSEEETGSTNVVTGMILGYRGFDTLGESCVLFLAVTAVMMLLLRNEDEDGPLEPEEDEGHGDVILKQAAWLLVPFIFLFAIYVLLHGEVSPGGGFSGGTILGAGVILFVSAFGQRNLRVFMDGKTYRFVRTFGLLLYVGLYGAYIFFGANGLPNYLEGMVLLIDLAVGLVVACTVYGFFALFSKGKI